MPVCTHGQLYINHCSYFISESMSFFLKWELSIDNRNSQTDRMDIKEKIHTFVLPTIAGKNNLDSNKLWPSITETQKTHTFSTYYSKILPTFSLRSVYTWPKGKHKHTHAHTPFTPYTDKHSLCLVPLLLWMFTC